jgi:arylsulfatase
VHQGRWQKGADPNNSKYKNCAVRSPRWRFVNNRELYDISVDPFEANDVSADHPEVVAELRRAFDVWWSETLPLMVNEDAPYSPVHPQAVRYEKQLEDRGIPDWEPPQL